MAISTLHHFFAPNAITCKKTAHSVEQDRADVLSAREDWFDGQLDLDPERLVFIKTWTATTKVLELVPTDHAHPYYYSLAEAAGLDYAYIAGYCSEMRERTL